jgi:hypothetical protein
MYCDNEKTSKYTKEHPLIQDLMNKRMGNSNDVYSHIAAFIPNLKESNLNLCYEGKDRYRTEL